MTTQTINTSFSTAIDLAAVSLHTRSKIISAADVWNIQRTTRARIQRRIFF